MHFIRLNRISTSQVSDILGKTGVIHGLRPLTPRIHRVGPVRWVYAYGESNWDFHDQIREVRPGEILFVEAFDCNDRAVFGSLVSKYLFLYRQVSAVIVQGLVRDVHDLIKEQYPLWSAGVTPLGCFNQIVEYPFDHQIIRDRRDLYDGSIAVCDDSGVVIIPKSRITHDLLPTLQHIEDLEDVWFDCIDRRKWDTYDTVCLKKYLDLHNQE